MYKNTIHKDISEIRFDQYVPTAQSRRKPTQCIFILGLRTASSTNNMYCFKLSESSDNSYKGPSHSRKRVLILVTKPNLDVYYIGSYRYLVMPVESRSLIHMAENVHFTCVEL